MAEATAQPPLRPKLHGRFVLSHLTGAGVVVQHEPELGADVISLSVGDTATHVVFVGTPTEVSELLREAHRQYVELTRTPEGGDRP